MAEGLSPYQSCYCVQVTDLARARRKEVASVKWRFSKGLSPFHRVSSSVVCPGELPESASCMQPVRNGGKSVEERFSQIV